MPKSIHEPADKNGMWEDAVSHLLGALPHLIRQSESGPVFRSQMAL